eukprot:TRINITY_DN44939_c0_g1_i1.p1 TRINITY_DN44939_c0_g1~~TRINITY_DN44939_c0_g1_i1.p1  ORF type:complete len:589 (+),score=153.93 TRINITY_DN44939_c0_g1_i1:87-1769(+)
MAPGIAKGLSHAELQVLLAQQQRAKDEELQAFYENGQEGQHSQGQELPPPPQGQELPSPPQDPVLPPQMQQLPPRGQACSASYEQLLGELAESNEAVFLANARQLCQRQQLRNAREFATTALAALEEISAAMGGHGAAFAPIFDRVRHERERFWQEDARAEARLEVHRQRGAECASRMLIAHRSHAAPAVPDPAAQQRCSAQLLMAQFQGTQRALARWAGENQGRRWLTSGAQAELARTAAQIGALAGVPQQSALDGAGGPAQPQPVPSGGLGAVHVEPPPCTAPLWAGGAAEPPPHSPPPGALGAPPPHDGVRGVPSHAGPGSAAASRGNDGGGSAHRAPSPPPVPPPAAPPAELRVDPADGLAYPYDDFVREYGEVEAPERWLAAGREPPQRAGCLLHTVTARCVSTDSASGTVPGPLAVHFHQHDGEPVTMTAAQLGWPRCGVCVVYGSMLQFPEAGWGLWVTAPDAQRVAQLLRDRGGGHMVLEVGGSAPVPEAESRLRDWATAAGLGTTGGLDAAVARALQWCSVHGGWRAVKALRDRPGLLRIVASNPPLSVDA